MGIFKQMKILKSLYSSVCINTTHFGKTAYTIKTNNRNHNEFIQKKITRSSVFKYKMVAQN